MKTRSKKPNCTAKTAAECMLKLTKYVGELDGAVGSFDSWSVLETGETVRVVVTWPAPKKVAATVNGTASAHLALAKSKPAKKVKK